MTVTSPTPVWKLPREAHGIFVGPLALTVTADGTPVDPTDVLFAVIPEKQRPVDTDWVAPVDNPDPVEGGVGVELEAVAASGLYGWWVQITVGSAVDVLEPPSVAWIIRL